MERLWQREELEVEAPLAQEAGELVGAGKMGASKR